MHGPDLPVDEGPDGGSGRKRADATATTKPVATPGAGTLNLAKEGTEDISHITETAFLLVPATPLS